MPLQRPGNYLGEVSYPLYLIHYPVFFLVYNGYFKEHPAFNTGLVEVSIAIVAACLVLHLIERPLRRRSFWVGGRITSTSRAPT